VDDSKGDEEDFGAEEVRKMASAGFGTISREIAKEMISEIAGITRSARRNSRGHPQARLHF
jgi:hypothetical protein